MSGIVGILRRDGATVRPRELDSMLDRLAHRGPDGRAHWCEESIGLGHCMLWTTPESFSEHLPAAGPDGAVVTSDARIDNREELAAELHLDAREACDSNFILAAWRKWGADCPPHLIGDYCFAIWDPRERKLFLARDPMGVRSLYYYSSAKLFAFASEIKALFALPEIPRNLNEVRVGDYLLNLFDDRTHTFFRGVCCLPAAQTLTVSRSKVDARTYWQFDPRKELRLKSDGEYTEAFRTHFLQAVKCRLRSAFPVGAALSGGLDSSSIACAARAMLQGGGDNTGPLHTFSAIFPESPDEDLKRIDERRWMNCALEQSGFEPHFIHADRLSPMRALDRVHYHLDEANFAPNLYMHWAMYEAARNSGVRVFLDGFDGDTTVSYGFDYLIDLARTFRWRTLRQEIEALSRGMLRGMRPRRVFKDFVAKEFVPDWLFAVRRLARGQSMSNRTLIHPDLVRRLDLKARARRLLPVFPGWRHTAREKHAAMFRGPLFPQTLEMADKAGAAFGVETRYPFFDRRLMEFCLAIPPEQKLGNGWSRLIFRRAMEGILPPGIQWRAGKGDLSSNFHRRLLACERDTLDRIVFEDSHVLDGYVDLSAMRAAWRAYGASPMKNPHFSMQIFAAANLGLWLRASGFECRSAAG